MKFYSSAIVPVVTEIFNKIIDEQEFPESGKKAIIKPLNRKERRINKKKLQSSVNVVRAFPNLWDVIV